MLERNSYENVLLLYEFKREMNDLMDYRFLILSCRYKSYLAKRTCTFLKIKALILEIKKYKEI